MIGVLVNRNAAGVVRRPGLAERLRAVVGGDGEVEETRTPEDLAAALERFRGLGCDAVASCGGDGTHLHTVTALTRLHGRDRVPRLLLLRAGTVNTIAENLGLRGPPEDALGAVVARIRSGAAPREIGHDTIEVTADEGAAPGQPLCGFLFAAAMGARYLEAYYRGAPLIEPGPLWATLLATRVAASTLVSGPLARRLFAPVPVEATADGEPLPIEAARLLLAATIKSVGIGFKVAWQAERMPNRFHLVVSALPLPSMALQLPRVFAGRPLKASPAGAPHIDRLVQRASFRFREPEPWTLDGDLFRARAIDLRMGPRLWLLMP